MSIRPIQNLSNVRKVLISVLFSVFSLGVLAPGVSAKPIKVNIDEAKLIELDRPVNQVIIGNPAIADVTLQSRKVLLFTGKSSGHTNIILLDENNRQILNRKVHVSTSNESGMVVVHRGTSRSSYHCGTICNGRLAFGDNTAYTEDVKKNLESKLGFIATAAKAGGGN